MYFLYPSFFFVRKADRISFWLVFTPYWIILLDFEQDFTLRRKDEDAFYRKMMRSFESIMELKKWLIWGPNFIFCAFGVIKDTLKLKILELSNRLPFICKNKKEKWRKMRYCQPKLLSNADYERKLNPFYLENMLEWPILNVIKPIYAFKGHSDKFPK